MIRIYQTADYEAMSRRAAHIIAAEVYRNPACVLGLATGSTPVGAYKCLSEMVAKGDLSFKEVKSVNLDEYKGLAPTHDQSYRYFMEDNLFNHVDIDLANTNVPNGLAEDAEAEWVEALRTCLCTQEMYDFMLALTDTAGHAGGVVPTFTVAGAEAAADAAPAK